MNTAWPHTATVSTMAIQKAEVRLHVCARGVRLHDSQPAKRYTQQAVGEYHVGAQGEAGKERHRASKVALGVGVTVIITVPIRRWQWGERYDTKGEV